jgi:plasmid maintenance system killer protein
MHYTPHQGSSFSHRITLEGLGDEPPQALKGDRAGQMSIRINDQWRICFRWSKGDAEGVEIVDYH